MVHYGQHAIKASALGEPDDEIHSDLCERGCILGNCDFVKWGAGFVCEVLVLLADCAPLYILFDPGSCSWPEIVATDLPCRFVSALMPSSYVVVPFSQHPPFDLVVWGNDESVAWYVFPHYPIQLVDWQCLGPLF